MQVTDPNIIEISSMLGSAVSAQIDGDEDIVIDSGGRKINRYNNWVDADSSYH